MRALLILAAFAISPCGCEKPAPATPLAVPADSKVTVDPKGKPKAVESVAELEGAVGKTVKLTGRVKEVSRFRKDEYVVLISWSTSTTVLCSFPGSETPPDWFNVTEKGQEFTVVGRVSKLEPGSVDLEDCQRVK